MELSLSDIWRASVSSLSPSMARSTIPQLRSSAFDIPAETAMIALQKFRPFGVARLIVTAPKLEW